MHLIIYFQEKEVAHAETHGTGQAQRSKTGNIRDKGSGKRHVGGTVGVGIESEVFCITFSCTPESIYYRRATKQPKYKTIHQLLSASLYPWLPKGWYNFCIDIVVTTAGMEAVDGLTSMGSHSSRLSLSVIATTDGPKCKPQTQMLSPSWNTIPQRPRDQTVTV